MTLFTVSFVDAFLFLYLCDICVGAWLRFMQLRGFFELLDLVINGPVTRTGCALSYSRVKTKIIENVANEIFVFVGCKCESRFVLLSKR